MTDTTAESTAATALDGAQWITHSDWAGAEPGMIAPILRTMINCDQPPVRAEVTIAGLGVWVAHLGGRAISADVLEPGSSEFTRRVAATTYDITELLAPDSSGSGPGGSGETEFLVQLGEGSAHVRRVPEHYTKFVGCRLAPRARVAIMIDFADGSSRRIVSGPDWRARLGPTTLSHWYGGEDYDARREPAGWLTREGSSDDDWEPAVVVGDTELDPQPWTRRTPPTRLQETLPAVARWLVGDSEIFDFGRNLAGREVLHIGAGFPAGTRIELLPTEYLGDDGEVDQHSTGSPIIDSYTTAQGPEPVEGPSAVDEGRTAPKGPELVEGSLPGPAADGDSTVLRHAQDPVWRPQFSYHGFRYVQVRAIGPDGSPVPIAGRIELEAERLMTDDRETGSFDCSDPVLAGVHTLVVNAIQSNLYSVPTDCPHREKLGWLEQLHLVFDPVARSFDIGDHFADMITHLADAQTADGLIPSIAPELVVFDHPTSLGDDFGFRDDVNWGSAIWQLPWELYRTYGDLEPARAAWVPGLAYLRYLEGIAGDGLLDHGLADWISLDDSVPRVLVASYGLIRMVDAGRRLAEVLGEQDEARVLAAKAERLRRLLGDDQVRRVGDDQVRPVDDDQVGGLEVGSGSQASLALMIDLGDVLTGEQVRQAEQALVERIHRDGDRFTVGEIGLPSLLRVLTRLGEHELIRTMITRTGVPSYGQMLLDGCTALAEHWTGAGSRKSANHFMLGYVDWWLTGSLGGLRQAPDDIGWRRAVVAIAPLSGIDRAQHDYRSAAGQWAVRWQRDGAVVRLQLTVPSGATADVVTPDGYRERTRGRSSWAVDGGSHVIDFEEIVTA